MIKQLRFFFSKLGGSSWYSSAANAVSLARGGLRIRRATAVTLAGAEQVVEGQLGTPQPPGESLLDSTCCHHHSFIPLSLSHPLAPLPYSPRRTDKWGRDGIPKGRLSVRDLSWLNTIWCTRKCTRGLRIRRAAAVSLAGESAVHQYASASATSSSSRTTTASLWAASLCVASLCACIRQQQRDGQTIAKGANGRDCIAAGW